MIEIDCILQDEFYDDFFQVHEYHYYFCPDCDMIIKRKDVYNAETQYPGGAVPLKRRGKAA